MHTPALNLTSTLSTGVPGSPVQAAATASEPAREPGPQRIVCLTEETVETLYLLGEDARIVGVSGYAVRPPQVRKEKPRVSAFISADVPKILALKPDLVLTFSDLQADIVADLVRANVAVHAFNQRDIAGIYDMIRTLGALVGTSAKADALAGSLAAHVDAVRERAANRDTTGDPWNGRTLEWATASPVPFYNFAVIPEVHERDAFWEMKKQGKVLPGNKPATLPKYEDIELPKNTAMAIYVSGFVFLLGFALVWHIMWLIALGLVGAIACVVIRSFDEHTEYIVPAVQVEKMEKVI